MLDNLQLSDNAAEKVVESLDKRLGKTYDLVINPSAEELGTGLASVVRLVFSPFQALNSPVLKEKLSTFIKELTDKRKKIPDNKIAEPDYQVIYVALENTKSCISNDELRHMFVNLIGNSMNSDIKNEIHPAFAAIIKELSSLDAQILKFVFPNRVCPAAKFITDDYITGDYSRGTRIGESVDIVIPDHKAEMTLQSASMANLKRLGLVDYKFERPYFPAKEYFCFFDILNKYKNQYYKFNEGYIQMTDYGMNFMRACSE